MAESSSGPQLGIERIYLRDVSFESPQAPRVFTGAWQPKVELNINTRTTRVDDVRHEVVLTLTLEARQDDEVALIVELQQAGVFRVEGVDDALLEQILATACPSALFPYAREAVDALVTKGSFPPFMLAPMNFDALYAEAKRRHAAAQEAGLEGQGDQFVN